MAFFASDAVYQEARHDPIVGRERIAAHWAAFFRGGPPWKLQIGEIVGDASAGRYAIAYVFHLQDEGGAWQARPGCALVHVRDDAITLWREYSG